MVRVKTLGRNRTQTACLEQQGKGRPYTRTRNRAGSTGKSGGSEAMARKRGTHPNAATNNGGHRSGPGRMIRARAHDQEVRARKRGTRLARGQGGKGQSHTKPRRRTQNCSNWAGSTGKGGSEAMARKRGTHPNAATKERQSPLRRSRNSGCRYVLSEKT